MGAHAGRCGDCHESEAEHFATSAHAAENPVFAALRDHADAEVGVGAFCDDCHRASEPMSCVTCHGAAGNQGAGSGVLLDDLTGPVRGTREVDAPHALVADGFLTSGDLCGTCHQVEGPGAFVESTYAEWTGSGTPERCQDCHVAGHGFVRGQGLELRAVVGGVELVNHAGHSLPTGASFVGELWVEGRTRGEWTGERALLHPVLRKGGELTWDPVRATHVESRALASGEVRFVNMQASEACIRELDVAPALAAALELNPAIEQVRGCVSLR